MREEDLFATFVLGLVLGLVILAVVLVAVPSAEDVEERWTHWQECIQTRAGGDASLEWCDATFRNPASQE